jgi:LysM repeat protein
MKPLFWIYALSAVTLALSSCGGGGGGRGPQAATGPFDSRGNYVEEWADNPSKWRKGGGSPSPHERKSDELPEIAKIEQPPQNAVPIPLATVSKPIPPISQTVIAAKPKLPAVKSEVVVATKATKRRVEESEERPTKAVKRTVERSEERTTTRSKSKAKPVVAKAKQKVVASKTKSNTATKAKSKTATKAKEKAKPKLTRYVVKKGDSLSVIARKTGSSTAAIKKKNGISGTAIRRGQTLVIPKN